MTDAARVLEMIAAEGVRFVDLRFTDLRGVWQHVGLNASTVDEGLLAAGVMLDGSGIEGWRAADDSDMLLRPDLSTHVLDPFSAQPTLVLIADVVEPAGGQGYDRCPRSTARRAVAHLAASGVADQALFGPELEFFVFDDVRFGTSDLESFVHLDAEAAPSNGGTRYPQGNAGHRIYRPRQRPVPPADAFADLRAEMCAVLESLGIRGLHHNHGRTACQNEIGFGHADPLATADRVQMAKYVVRNVAASYGKSATFMPRPSKAPLGASSLHVHQSLWKAGKPLFAGHDYANMSETSLHYVAGLLHHARALNAFANPTTNSYRRLAGGEGVPRWLAYSAQNRSAAVRIPYAARAEDKRAELRFADPAANPYLAFAAMLMAGLDGISRRLDPGEAMDRNLYDLPPGSLGDLDTVAPDLDEALGALDRDRAFLTEGEVFSPELIDVYIELRRREGEAVKAAPHPLEFELYYDA